MTEQHHEHHRETEELTHRQSWNNLYSEREQVWSGQPNATLVSLIERHQPGAVLDLGCGEGGDVLWLAQRGWDATGIDISDIAIERARKAAEKAGVTAQFVASDLEHWQSEQSFDLIISSFMQSHFQDLDRVGIFRTALEYLTVGGELVSLSHAGIPSWVSDNDPRHEHAHRLPIPEQEARALIENDDRFEVLIAEKRERRVTSPEGKEGTIDDGVLVIRRVK